MLASRLKDLEQACKRLEKSSGRIARRNARRAVWGAMKSLKNACNEHYPSLQKTKPAAEPKPAREKKPRLPFTRAWDINRARLFTRVCADTFNLNVPVLSASEWCAKRNYIKGTILFQTTWPDYLKWLEVVHHFSVKAKVEASQVIDLWGRFWKESLPLADLELAAEQQQLIK